jgi:NADH-quinone oxidoreductase subunit C
MPLDNATVEARVRAQFGAALLDASVYRNDLALRLPPAALRDVAAFLRDDPQLQYIYLESVSGVDYLDHDPRFEVVYHMVSLANRHRLALKVGVNEDEPVPTLVDMWPTATFQEREVFDMFGVPFAGHPSLQRILMPDDWDGHPQRKDHPLVYEEVAFTFNHDAVDALKPYARE